VKNGCPAVFWTALAGPEGIFHRDVKNTKMSGTFFTHIFPDARRWPLTL
jgi:hypothetical protein